jgi:hypothetical protein
VSYKVVMVAAGMVVQAETLIQAEIVM